MNILFSFILGIFLIPGTLLAYSGGITGQSSAGCSCHGAQNSNTVLSLREGSGPFSVQAGASKTFTAVVAHGTLNKAGMNLSIKNSSNQNAGTFSATTNCSPSAGELMQTSTVNMSNGEAEFGFTWTAPSTPGTYTIRMAGNAVNGNGGTSGDQWNLMNEVTITVTGSGSSITLTSQNSPSSFCRNAPVNITWTGSGLSGNTGIELSSTGGAPWTQIGSVPASTLNFTWNVPAGQTFGTSYRIRVINGTAIDTIDAPISILPIPLITSNPPPLDTACIGQSRTLSVAVQSDENVLSFQWMKNNTPIPGATSKSYLFTTTANSAGNYTCVVSGCNQAMSTIAQLVIAEPTAIVTQPSAINGCKNSAAQLSIVATGTNLSYQWSKDGTPIPNSNRSSISFASLQPNDAGTYTCTISGYCGAPITSTATTVSIIPSPIATLQFSNDTAVCIGKELRLRASGTGGVITSYVWKRNGTVLPITDSVLVIPSVSLSSAGIYTVAVRNTCDELSAEKTVNVFAKEAPSILRQPRDTSALQGTIATLRIIASGTDMRYQWRKNGSNRSGDTNAILTIASVSFADSGSYDCIISNTCQTITSNPAQLSVTKAPSGPRIALTQSSIDFGCIDKGTTDTKTIQGLIKNEGESELIIADMIIAGPQSSRFTFVGGTSFAIAPGAAKDITVTFNADDIVLNTADLTIKSNSTTGDKTLGLIAKSCFERIDTTGFVFGTVSTGMKNVDTIIRICNVGSKKADITALSIIGSDKFAINNGPTIPFSIAPGDCQTLNITCNVHQSGTYTAGLRVTSTKGDYTIPLSIELVSSINETEYADLRIMPNPAQTFITIEGVKSLAIESITLISLMGQTMLTKEIPILSDKIDIPLNELSSGIYMLRMLTHDGTYVMRQLIKQD